MRKGKADFKGGWWRKKKGGCFYLFRKGGHKLFLTGGGKGERGGLSLLIGEEKR